ncbi:hypothetical protein CerSpe_201490 [Prunus speciosa]
MEAELQCSNAIQSMERKLRIACHVLKTAKSKVDSYDAEISSMKLEIKDLSKKLEAANAQAHSLERGKKKRRLDQSPRKV